MSKRIENLINTGKESDGLLQGYSSINSGATAIYQSFVKNKELIDMGVDETLLVTLESYAVPPQGGFTIAILDQRIKECDDLFLNLERDNTSRGNKIFKAHQFAIKFYRDNLDATYIIARINEREGKQNPQQLHSYKAYTMTLGWMQDIKNRIIQNVQSLKEHIDQSPLVEYEPLEDYVDYYVDACCAGKNLVDQFRAVLEEEDSGGDGMGYRRNVLGTIYKKHKLPYVIDHILQWKSEREEEFKSSLQLLYPDAKKAYFKLKSKNHLIKLCQSVGGSIMEISSKTNFHNEKIEPLPDNFFVDTSESDFLVIYYALCEPHLKEIVQKHLYASLAYELSEEQKKIDQKRIKKQVQEEERKEKKANKVKNSVKHRDSITEQSQEKETPLYMQECVATIAEELDITDHSIKKYMMRMLQNKARLALQQICQQHGITVDQEEYNNLINYAATQGLIIDPWIGNDSQETLEITEKQEVKKPQRPTLIAKAPQDVSAYQSVIHFKRLGYHILDEEAYMQSFEALLGGNNNRSKRKKLAEKIFRLQQGHEVWMNKYDIEAIPLPDGYRLAKQGNTILEIRDHKTYDKLAFKKRMFAKKVTKSG